MNDPILKLQKLWHRDFHELHQSTINKYRQIHWSHSDDMWRDGNVYEVQLLLSSGPQSNSETAVHKRTL